MRTSRGTAAIRRTAIAVALVATVATSGAIGAAPASAQAPGPAPTTAPSAIATSFTPGPATPGCTAFPLEVTHSAGSTPQEFRIRITLARRLCTPVGATAVVYAMPSYSTAWPQTLVERTSITLQEPGTYVVSFTKGCNPQQFDLLAGTAASITPQVISPTGIWHGPLLFPFDLSTSLQWRGCGPDPVIPEFPTPALALGVGALAAGGAVWWRRRHTVGSPA
ncbi:MAG: hypothetical protein ACOYOQ_06080 [Microthrixaceae bacterium]